MNTSDIGDISSTSVDDKASRIGATGSTPEVKNVSDVSNVDGIDNVSNQMFDTNEWNGLSQRPTRSTRRPSHFRDTEFETQFRREERRTKCYRLGRGDQAEKEIQA